MPAEVKLRNIRYFESEQQKAFYEEREAQKLNPHLNPGSVFIAAMGNHWHEGCYEAVKAMADETYKEGRLVHLCEIQDRCFNPYDALGVMRNLAYMRAIAEGFEYILYCDNDVLPAPDVLVKLLLRPVPILSPVITYADGKSHGLAMPGMERNKGLALVTSCVLSFVLFKTAVFLPWALIPFWQDAIGASENYHWQRLAMIGHMPFVDTDVEVVCVSPPHYPLNIISRGPNSLEAEFVT